MPWSEALYPWLIHSAIASLLVLTVGSVAVLLCRRPARRVWIIELVLAGCLIAPWLGMIPGYPRLGLGWRAAASLHQEEAVLPASATGALLPVSTEGAETVAAPSVVPPSDDLFELPRVLTPAPASAVADAPSRVLDHASWIVAAYTLGVALGLGWWLVGLLGLVKIVGTTRPAPSRCREVLAQIAGQRGSRVRLLVSSRARQPFAFALGRPVIVLPENLCGDVQAMRWSLAHEWTHIERHDFRAWRTAGLARVLFFYHPLVWWLRRQLRLCQDFLADDRAARQTAQPEDYAEFLTACAATGSLRPVLAGLGMGFSKSELYRRVVMLVQNRSLESRPPRLWTVTVTCVALFLVAVMSALTNSPTAAAGAGPAPGDSASSFVAKLPDGITIELLGVSTHPSNEKSWWRPDGSPLAEPPCDPLKDSGGGSPESVLREVALQLRGLPAEAVDTQVRFEPAYDSFAGARPTRHDKTVRGLEAVIVSLGDQPTVTVRVDVAAGPWQTVCEIRKEALPPIGSGSSIGTTKGTFVLSPIIEKDDRITVTVAYNIVGPQSRLVAVGLDGREHSDNGWCKGCAAEFEQITATFSRIPLKDIKTFRLQTRPYKWVEFRNVSLRVGHKTDVHIAQSSSRVGPAQIELLEGPDVLVIRGKQEDVRRISSSLTWAGRGEKATVPKPPSGGQSKPASAGPATAQPAKAKITLESLGFTTSSSGAGIDEETEKLIKEKKYEFVKTFDTKSGEKQYVYRFTYPDGRQVNRNFPLPLDNVTSRADYQKKHEQQRERRNERISQALTSGRFRLLNLEVLQVHLCRDVESGTPFKVQRIQRPDGTEIALPRPDYGPIPPSVHQTSWQDHVQAIRDGKRNLLSLETVNSYTYEMTADDGTKEIFSYGGNDPLDVILKRPGRGGSLGGSVRSVGGKPGEMVVGVRPQGNCSISGTVISEATGKPVARAQMYLHYNVTHGSIFVNTDSEGKFEIKDIPTGPFSLCSSHTGGYQDAAYSPDGTPGRFPPFSLKDGEHRTGIVLTIKQACRVFGKVRDENGKVPEGRTWQVLAWREYEGSKGYHSQHATVNHTDGSYVIDGLSNKPVYVMAIDWRAAKEGSAWPAIYYPSSFSRADARQVVFDKSRHVDEVNITLRKEGGIVIEGTVRDEAGKPVPEAFVVVHRRDTLFDYNTAYTDAQGHYRVQGLGAGSLLVHVDAAHRGFVRTRTPIELDRASKKVQRDFTLHRGVSISGKFVDEKGQAWQIGTSYAYASQVSKDRPARNQNELNEGNFSLSDFQNKHRPKDVRSGFPGAFLLGEGDYDCDQAVFPTTSTFIIQGMMPGHTIIGLSPKKEKQGVVKILYGGRDILKSGIDTKAGDEVKDITIVVGRDRMVQP